MLTTALLGYVGPGAGMGALGAVIALIISVVVALGVLLFWPIRLLMRKMGLIKPPPPEPDSAGENAAASDSKPAE